MGNWKGIRKNIFEGNMTIELYDLERDIQEQYDIAQSRPDIIAKIEKIMVKAHTPSQLDRFKFPQLGD